MKQTYIWGIIGIIVVVGLGYFAWGRGNGSANVIGETFERDSIDDLIGTDKAYLCDVQSKLPGRESQGTVYLDGNSFKADFTSFVPELNTEIEIHTLWDGEAVYSWTSLSPVGSKAVVTREQITFNNSSADESEQVVYSCNEVTKDTSQLELPENISFEEVAVDANTAPEETTEGESMEMGTDTETQ